MTPEKRQCERSDILLTVEFKQPGGKTSHSLGITRNFSPEGLSFDSQNYDLGSGGVLECTLKHPGADWSASVLGEIMWKKESWYKCMTGLKFIDLEEEKKSNILKFISSNKAAPEPSLHSRHENVSDELTAHSGIYHAIESVAAASRPAGDIAEEEFTDKATLPETGHIRQKRVSRKQMRTAHDRIIRNPLTASSPSRNKGRNILIAVAGFAVIASGIVFLISGTPMKDIKIIAPVSPKTENAPPLIDVGNSQAHTLSGKTHEPEQMNTAQDNLPESRDAQVEQPVTNIAGKSINSDQPASGSVTQRDGEGIKRSPSEPVLISRTESGTPPVENTPRVRTDNLPLADTRPEAAKQAQPDLMGKAPSSPEVKDQAISKEVPALENNVPDRSVENKLPEAPRIKTRIFEDSFKNNANNWDTFNTVMAAARIEPGEYHIQNKRKAGAHIILHHADFPFHSDFSLEASIRLVKSSDNFSYGLVLGAKDALNNFAFQVNSAGFCSVRQYHEGAVRELMGRKMGSAVTQNSINVLKVVKQGDSLRFYINDVLADEISDVSFDGNKVGFIIEGESEIAVSRTRTQVFEY
jgi:hypothetical protein